MKGADIAAPQEMTLTSVLRHIGRRLHFAPPQQAFEAKSTTIRVFGLGKQEPRCCVAGCYPPHARDT
jgi:hypothetical protein